MDVAYDVLLVADIRNKNFEVNLSSISPTFYEQLHHQFAQKSKILDCQYKKAA